MQKTVAEIDMKATLSDNFFRKGELPWQYVFIDPLLLDVVGGPLALFRASKGWTFQKYEKRLTEN